MVAILTIIAIYLLIGIFIAKKVDSMNRKKLKFIEDDARLNSILITEDENMGKLMTFIANNRILRFIHITLTWITAFSISRKDT
jgi:hypothetical protein